MNLWISDLMPFIDRLIKMYPGITCEIEQESIKLKNHQIPFAFTLTYFHDYGWQAFMTPSAGFKHDYYSERFYDDLNEMLVSYNMLNGIYQEVELSLFAV